MTYKTDEERKQAIKESKRRYYLKTRHLKGYPSERPYARKPKEYHLFSQCKHRAKQAGLEFSIEVSDIVIPDVCPVLGFELSRSNQRNLPNSPSVDRFDNSKGYTKDNIRIISWRANKLKCDATPSEMAALAKYMNEE